MPQVIESRPGSNGFSKYVRKFARSENLSGGDEAVMWDGNTEAFVGWLDSEEDIEWASDSAEDAAGGTGCNYLQFTGQGEDGIEKTYSGELTGLTWNQLSVEDAGVLFDIIYTAQCINTEGESGAATRSPLVSNGCANIGTITIRSVTTQTVLAKIKPGRGRTQMMVWRCPSDTWARFEKIDVYPSDNQAFTVRLMGRTGKEYSWLCIGEIYADNYEVAIVHPFPDYVAPGVDLALVVEAGSNGASCAAQMWLEKVANPNYEE